MIKQQSKTTTSVMDVYMALRNTLPKEDANTVCIYLASLEDKQAGKQTTAIKEVKESKATTTVMDVYMALRNTLPREDATTVCIYLASLEDKISAGIKSKSSTI
jgi:uncharacterized protein YsxB (DUF464 family)